MPPPALLQLAEEDTQDQAEDDDDDESVKTEDVDYEPELGVRQTHTQVCAGKGTRLHFQNFAPFHSRPGPHRMTRWSPLQSWQLRRRKRNALSIRQSRRRRCWSACASSRTSWPRWAT